MVAEHPRWEGMSARERIWYEKLCRRLGVNRVCGPLLDKEGTDAVHELLRAMASGTADDNTTRRLVETLRKHQVRVEDGHSARLGLPPRPR